jgi:hypothetical protein
VLAVYPRDLDELFACPGMAEGDPPTFVMTIQEQPLALAGEATAPWPVEPRPLSIEGLAESACYPGWELLGNDWTAAGRSYQARVGFAPEASDQDRRSLLDAFASMTFEAAPEPAASVVLATGTAGGEEWDLIAERQTDGLSLSLDAETFGAGIGGFDPATPELQFSIHTFGVGDSAETVLFGAVPIEAVRIGARVTVDDEAMVDVLDVPDSIDPAMNAFVVAVTGSPVVTISAYDASGRVVVSATVDAAAGTPVEAPPWRSEVEPEHGGTYWGVYLAVAASLDDPKIREWTEQAERLAYTPSVGDLACDQGAAAALGVAEGSSRVAIYFATREDAEAAYADVVTRYREPFGIARVTTYCLD